MEHRSFGQTGLEVSAIGFGCWEVGGGYGQVEETEFARAVGRALDLGINCFDTAEGYGMGASERALGEALGGRRDEAIVVTKFGMNYRDKPNFRDSSRERVLASIDKSLKNLGTDWVDVYLVHWPDRTTPFEETMSALDDVVRDGKARFVGLSNFKRDEIEACARRRAGSMSSSTGGTCSTAGCSATFFPYCEDNGIGYMAYGSLAYGLLTGTFTEDTDFGSEDWRSRQGKMGSIKLFNSLFGAESFPNNVRAVDELKDIAARYGKSLPQFALALVDRQPGRQHRARRLPHRRRSRRQRRRVRLVDQRRRPRGDRCDLRTPRRGHDAGLLDRRGLTWPAGRTVRRVADDLVIRGGKVYDGTGSPGRDADVAIADGVIRAIGPDLHGPRELDASGCAVTPGFIDIHTHYDAQVFWDPALRPSSYHGVTTVVAGNCGFAIAPTRPEHRDVIVHTLENVEDMDPATLTAGIAWDFETFPEYLDAVARRGTVINFTAYVGHSPIRLYVMGDAAYERTATPDEVERMCALVRDAIDSGAAGFSTSFSYAHRGRRREAGPESLCRSRRSRRAVPRRGRSRAGRRADHAGRTVQLRRRVRLAAADRASLHVPAVRGARRPAPRTRAAARTGCCATAPTCGRKSRRGRSRCSSRWPTRTA